MPKFRPLTDDAETIEDAAWYRETLEARRDVRREQDTCGSGDDCVEERCPCALLASSNKE